MLWIWLLSLQFKKTQELHQIRQKETDLTAEIQGAKAASRNLSSKLNKLDQEALKQQEIIYNQVCCILLLLFERQWASKWLTRFSAP